MQVSTEPAAGSRGGGGGGGGPHTRSILDTGIILDKPDQLRVDNLAEVARLPVASVDFGVAALCRRVVEQILQGLLCEGGLT